MMVFSGKQWLFGWTKWLYIFAIYFCQSQILGAKKYQRTIGPENAHLKPDPGVLSHHEMTLTLNTHTPLLNS